MSNCGNCEWYTCEHKYGVPLKENCPKYQPHYLEDSIPILDDKVKKVCGNCKHWGDEKLIYEGKELDHIRRCMKVTQEGIKIFTIADSPCDEEDINGWEAKDGYSTS